MGYYAFLRKKSLKHIRDVPEHSKAGHPESWPKAGSETKLERPEEEHLPRL